MGNETNRNTAKRDNIRRPLGKTLIELSNVIFPDFQFRVLLSRSPTKTKPDIQARSQTKNLAKSKAKKETEALLCYLNLPKTAFDNKDYAIK